MKYLFLITFAIFSVLHLIASYQKKDFFRGVTKGFILFPLMAYYILEVGNENASWIVLLALLFSWLGDMFLIPKSVKWFVVGGLCFWASHFLFIFSYIEAAGTILCPIWLIIVLALVYGTIVTITFSKLKAHLPKALFYPMYLYLLTNGAMNVFAIMRLTTAISNSANLLGPIIAVIGAMLFFVSDNCLFFVRFNRNTKFKSHFLVMLTYLVGEFLIVLGFIL